ncbi:spermidine synthase [Legionella quinlivanii]|uniref:Spermidine synthase n=1 Tax=Legionella quinlivanii TaxID=45073 RepID=A0A0W0XUI5_9GAMM|nr:hypothetical protein [Legionella quinlivanii]KTD48201.1 spermidine synthase [Legionella quinlivanii]MCW8450469.1 hypothetical protein [Legionella quinlivanii]SEF99073.1 Spermine/spermidine synthase [Legionella quinlivanii DSM 21216]STY11351.1 spermidine synthase [Legionella quinlivanii]
MWKTFAGRCLYHSESGISVYDNFIFRWLSMGSPAIQSLINVYKPEKPGLNYISALILPARLFPGPSCLLGLGGAGAAHALSPVLTPFSLTAIEINEEIIQVAKTYFMTERLKNLNIINQDASTFITNNKTQFQHILVDLFDAHRFPPNCYNPQFFSDCQNALSANGYLSVNLANRKEQYPVFQWLKHQFDMSTLVLPVRKSMNMIIIAADKPALDILIEQLKARKIIRALAWDPIWNRIARTD